MEEGAMVARDPAVFELRLLGGFELRSGGRPQPVSASSQRLLSFLALNEGTHPRSFVAGSLWPDVTDQRAVGNLRATIWRTPSANDGLLSASANNIGLAEGVATDYQRAIALTRRVLHGEDVQVHELQKELLPGCVDEWVIRERERLRQITLHAVEERCRRLVERGEPALAIDLSLAAAAAGPLRESAHRCLISAHLAEGNVGEAVQAYHSFCSRLWAALHLRPSPIMEALMRPVLGAT